MVSKSKLKRQQKKEEAPEKPKVEVLSKNSVVYIPDRVESTVSNPLEQVSATGILDSQEGSHDIAISKFSVSISNFELIQEATLQINRGNRYGVIGSVSI